MNCSLRNVKLESDPIDDARRVYVGARPTERKTVPFEFSHGCSSVNLARGVSIAALLGPLRPGVTIGLQRHFGYSANPSRYGGFTNLSASGQLGNFMFAASHSSFWFMRIAMLPSSTTSARCAA